MGELATKETVLIVEDDAMLRLAAVELFTIMGYDTATAENGYEALKLLEGKDHLFDIIFCDVVLSEGLNGIELAEKAKDMHPEIRVLIASGYPFEKFHDGKITEDCFISKPYRTAELTEKLEGLKNNFKQ